MTIPKNSAATQGPSASNSSLDGNARRAIDIHPGEDVDKSSFTALIREAVAVNGSGLNSSGLPSRSKKAKS